MDLLFQANDVVNAAVWGPFMLILLLGFGVCITIATKFFQFTHFPLMLKKTLGSLFHQKKDREHGISPFQAVSTALAGTLGTGNIIGVATAIVSGGPGAIFWMWVSAFFGMMTKYAEVVLAVKYRSFGENGEPVGGPMYYISKGMNCKWLAVVFCIFCCLASFGIGSMVQSNSVSGALYVTFHIPAFITGILLAVLVAVVILGGVQRIGKITEKVVPFMAVSYTFFAVLALCFHFSAIDDAFCLIFQSAFTYHAAIGGGIGYTVSMAIRYGMSRGVFSNEAGLGSAPIAHAAADTKSPVEQGMWGIFEVFFDTIVMCTLTALVLLTSGLCQTGLDGADLTLGAFSSSVGSFAEQIIAIAMVFFAFASMIGWAYYGEKSIEYIFKKRMFITAYRVIYVLSVALGAVAALSAVWEISDTLNGLMIIPNLAALIYLSPVVVKETKLYLKQRKGVK